jgi:hypothetical protein
VRKPGEKGLREWTTAISGAEVIPKARQIRQRRKRLVEKKRQAIPSVSSWKFGILAFSFDRPRLNPIKKDVTKTVMTKTALKNALIDKSSLGVFIFAERTEKVNKKAQQ